MVKIFLLKSSCWRDWETWEAFQKSSITLKRLIHMSSSWRKLEIVSICLTLSARKAIWMRKMQGKYLVRFWRQYKRYTTKVILRKLWSVMTMMMICDSGVTHRDLKDENVLIDTKGNITLIDFGSGSFIESLEDTEFEGTRIYSPPEWIQDQR